MNRKRLFFVMMTVFVCLNPLPAVAQWWDDWYEYEHFSYEEYYDPGPVYYYQSTPRPIVIGIGGCNRHDD